MKPFTIYHSFIESFTPQQEKLVSLITGLARPDMVYLLGASLYRRRSESIFNPEAPTSQLTADYFFLVLLKGFEGKDPYEWQDKIEQQCSSFMPVTVIVLDTGTFTQWVETGHRFAGLVVQSAVAIYDAGTISFSPAATQDDTAALKAAEKYCKEGLVRAKEFLAGAELFRVRNQNKMAAFMLHQATEHALHALLKGGTGYHTHTHSIERLVRYGSLVSYQLPDIFPRKTEQDKRLFALLQKAYVEARYKEDYSISVSDLLLLTEKVRHLQDIVADMAKSLFPKTIIG